MTPLKTYDLAAVILIVGGYEISGYGEDGGVEFEYASPVLEHVAPADGGAVVSRTNDDRMIARITVMETSRSYRDLSTLAKSQANQTAILALPFLLRDLINGDEVSDQYAAFLQVAAPSKSRAAGERVFEILLPNGRRLAKFGSSISL